METVKTRGMLGPISQETMNERPQGLISRISTLLNNEICSDVVFHVKHNGQRGTFYAHSPILIAAGNSFPDLAKQTSQAKVIKILEFSPHIVEMMLRYLYTDELNILSMENATDLYKLAHMYQIGDLEKLCSNYITKEEVNIDNLFVKYESALSCSFPILLQKCRNLVQSETKAVFASRYFGEAPFTVVEDMFSLYHMNVSGEFDVIQAAFRWSECECRRKGRPTEKLCVRDAIEPLLKHLRFLSLSADEFCDFTAREDNILTNYETVLITRKILVPDQKVDFPDYLCAISKPRQPYRRIGSHTNGMNNFSGFYSEQDNKNAFKDLYSEAFNINTSKDLHSDPGNKNISRSHSSEQYLRSVSEPINRDNNRIPEPVNKIKFNDWDPDSTSGIITNKSSLRPVNSVKYGQDNTLFYHQNKSPPASAKVEQSSIYQFNQNPASAKSQQTSIYQFNQNQRKSTPMLKVMPQQNFQQLNVVQSGRLTFDFQLQEMEKNFGITSLKDIKCNAKIQMRAGAILIHGIELKIAEQKFNPDPEETFVVFSCISNNYPPKVETFELKLKNNVLSVMYSEPVKVTPENPTDIEISIEDLLLFRCFACQAQNYEINCGLNVKAAVTVKSNQSNGQDNILYLISRIVYSTCSQF